MGARTTGMNKIAFFILIPLYSLEFFVHGLFILRIIVSINGTL